jgi:hypothetical protein
MSPNLNLAPERGPNLWLKHGHAGRRQSEVGGALLVAAGVIAILAGGRLLYRTVRETAKPLPAGRWDDLVDDESAGSFPASDAPSWTSAGARLDVPRRLDPANRD